MKLPKLKTGVKEKGTDHDDVLMGEVVNGKR